jgi:hypothetical protein
MTSSHNRYRVIRSEKYTSFEQPPRTAHGNQVAVGVQRVAVSAQPIVLKRGDGHRKVESSGDGCAVQSLADKHRVDKGM